MAAPRLFQPLKVGPITLPNRIVVAPMCQYSGDGHGNVTDWHFAHLGSLAASRAGLVIVEATGVEPEARISPWDVGLYSDENENALKPILNFFKANAGASKIGIQLAHAGRKACSGRLWDGGKPLPSDHPFAYKRYGPSAIPFSNDWPAPIECTHADLDRIVHQWKQAAERAVRLGFDAIEIHSTHGYLLSSFLSPLSNKRTDEYGGSFENRLRLPLRVVRAVKSVLPPNVALGIRVTGTDWAEGGWTPEDASAYSLILAKEGVHYISVSSGGTVLTKIPTTRGYQVPFAVTVKKALQQAGFVNSPVVFACGMILEPQESEDHLAGKDLPEDSKSAAPDAIALARSFLDNPRWPWHAAQVLGFKTFDYPPQYLRGTPPTWRHPRVQPKARL